MPTPKSKDELSGLLARYREHYNHRRHQALNVGHTHPTPGQAWVAGEQRGSDGTAIDTAERQGTATTYKERQVAQDAEGSSGEPGEGTLLDKEQQGKAERSVQTGILHEQAQGIVKIPRTNPQIYFRGRIYRDGVHDVQHL